MLVFFKFILFGYRHEAITVAKRRNAFSPTPWIRKTYIAKRVGVSHRLISASLLCPYVKVFVRFKTARRQEEKKQLDPWIVPPASGSLGSASGLLSPINPANSARASELDKVAFCGKEMYINRLKCVLSVRASLRLFHLRFVF